MAIIIREEKVLPNGVTTTVKRYVSDVEPLSGAMRKRAEKNDAKIQAEVQTMEKEIAEMGLFQLRGKPDVLKLWYEVGKRLSFVDDLELSPTARKYIWRAIYDHCELLYTHENSIPVRLKDRPTTSNLRYSYLLGKFEWDFVHTAGNWTAWVEFLDSSVMREDSRIIEWIKGIQEKTPLRGDFLRDLNKEIRHRFKGIVTSELPENELFNILDEVYEKALSEYTGRSRKK